MTWVGHLTAVLLAGWLGHWVGGQLGGSAWHAVLMGGAWAAIVLLLYRRIT